MVKKLNGYFYTKKVRHKFLVKVRPFSGSENTTIRNDKPDDVIMHTLTNDIRREKTASQIARSITELAMSLKDNDNSVIVSGIVPRHYNLNDKANKVNNRLVLMCKLHLNR